MSTMMATTNSAALLQDENPIIMEDNSAAQVQAQAQEVHAVRRTSAGRRMSRLWRHVLHRAGHRHHRHHRQNHHAVHQRRTCATAATVMAAATVLATDDANDSTNSNSHSSHRNSTATEPPVQENNENEDDSEEEESSEEEEEEEEEEEIEVPPSPSTTTALATHYNVSCDECGVMPIVGCRYKSLQRPNYDVCAACLHENYSAADVPDLFVVLEHNEIVRVPTLAGPTTVHTSAALLLQAPLPDEHVDQPAGLVPMGRSVTLHSLYELLEVLEDQDTSTLTTLTNRTEVVVQDVSLYIGTPTQPYMATKVVQALHRNTSILSMHIYIFGTEHATCTMEALAQGLEGNTSVTTVAWHIIVTAPQHPPLRVVAPPISTAACAALQHLVECPTHGIRFMFFKYNTMPHYHPATAAAGTGAALLPQGAAASALENALFQGLLTTHLHTFRYEGPTPVAATNQRVAWKAMETNPHIHRIKATFVSDTTTTTTTTTTSDSNDDTALPNKTNLDFWLEFLTLDKKYQWMKRWNSWTTMPHEQWAILEHAVQLSCSNNSKNDKDDDNDATTKVPILYHFLRQQPGWCLLPQHQQQSQSQSQQSQQQPSQQLFDNGEDNESASYQEIWV